MTGVFQDASRPLVDERQREEANIRNLHGKTALVTGGMAGLGAAIVRRLHEEGCRLWVVDLADADVAIARLIGDAFTRADITDPAAMETAIAAAVARHGRLDILVNNAGIEGEVAALHESSIERWRRVIDVDLHGVYHGLRAGLAQMVRQGGPGAIVNMSSVSGIVGYRTIAAYTAAKAAVINLTRTAALEYGPFGIRVNAVAPTAVLTPMVRRSWGDGIDERGAVDILETMNPLAGMPTPDDIAAAVAFLASDEARFITGVTLPVDGGLTAQ